MVAAWFTTRGERERRSFVTICHLLWQQCFSPAVTSLIVQWERPWLTLEMKNIHFSVTQPEKLGLILFIYTFLYACTRTHIVISIASLTWAHLVLPPLPAGQYAEPGTSPHRTVPRSSPLPLTAGRMYSMTRCHTLRGHVSDHAHRICWTIDGIREKKSTNTFTHFYNYLPREGDLKPSLQ